MPTSPVFGTIFVASNLIEDISSTLQRWFPSFIREIEAQNNLPVGDLQAPQRFTKRNDIDAVVGETLPKCIVVAPGLMGQPVKRGNGQYEATWRIGVGVMIAKSTEDDAILYADILGAAARDIMLKRAGDFCSSLEWIDESYDDRPFPNMTSYYRLAALWFSVTINNVATKRGGPDIPDDEPYAYGTAETIDVQLTKEPL